MAIISLKWFGGMAPRRGEQHLPAPHATEAENVDLFSGELRPMKRPALAHQFCRPTDECWNQPLPDDPSYPPTLPPGPGEPGYPGGPGPCVIPVITDGPVDAFGFIGDTVAFEITIDPETTQPVAIQWFEDNMVIPGATSERYEFVITEENADSEFTVSVENSCGVTIGGPVAIDLEVPEECEPYDCIKLRDAMLAGMTLEGSGMWSLLEPSDKVTYPVVPEFPTADYAYQTASGTHGLRAVNGAGASWTSNVWFGQSELNVGNDDLDLCTGPYVWRNVENNQTGTQAYFQLDPLPKWGGIIPNCNMAVVIRDADTGVSDPDSDNYLWRGTTRFRAWGQTGLNNASIENRVQCMRRSVGGTLYDTIGFNWGLAAKDWYHDLPFGTLRFGNQSVLVQVSISHGSIRFIPSSYQGYYYASYDMMAFVSYHSKVTTAAGQIYEDSTTFEYKVAQVFDHSHGNGFNRPFNTDYWPFDNGTLTISQIMLGGFGAMYNLSFKSAGNEGAPNNLITGGGNGGVDSSLSLRFLQNLSEYEKPPECGA